MAVFLRKGTWYLDVRLDGAYGKRLRIPLSENITTEEQARECEQQVLITRRPRVYDQQIQGSTVSELWPHYEIYIRLHRRPKTANDVAITGRNLIKVLGTVPVESLNDGLVTLYKHTRQGKVCNGSINKELAWFSGFCTWLRKQGRDVPRITIERLPYHPAIPTVLTPQEVSAILKAANPFYRAYFGCAYFCGLRRAEIRDLEWRNIDQTSHTLRVEGKGGRYRILPLPSLLLSWLQEVKNGNEGYVFWRHGVKTYWIQQGLNRLTHLAGITKHITCHTFRHSFGTHLAAEDVNLETIKQLLGHANIATTTIYTHMGMLQKRKASEKLMQGLDLDNVGQQKKALPLAKPRVKPFPG